MEPVTLSDFIQQSLQAESCPQLEEAFGKALLQLGYDRLMYSVVSSPTRQAGSPPLCIASTYPEEWLLYYQKQDYQKTDPLRRYGQLYRGVFSWKELAATYSLSRKEKAILNEAVDAGLYDGAAVPLHGPGGEVMGLAVASSQPLPERPDRLSWLSMLTSQFHTTHSLLRQKEVPAAPLPKLSKRELEVLQWAAQGKSNWSIGEILNISQHGVDYHFRNILRKLEADSRVTAVVKGLYFGLIVS